MSKILSVGTACPDYQVKQEDVEKFVLQLFEKSYPNIKRLLPVFKNGGIQKRHLAKPIEWYGKQHTFSEKNQLFIESAVELCIKAINDCFKPAEAAYQDIDAIFMISTTGISTPSLEARIMNQLPFQPTVRRVPIWGLGCAGGAAGLSRAHDYCKAYPSSNVLVIAAELCSLTFQPQDLSKSNMIGTSLFSDGVACVLVSGEESELSKRSIGLKPSMLKTQSVLMKDSLDVMGWDVRDEGLYVIFSKDIPTIVKEWVHPQIEQFLQSEGLTIEDIQHAVAHPGGEKVLQAYENSLGFLPEKIALSRKVLSQYGNMSSATVLFVLKEYLENGIQTNDLGLLFALGPGFSSEMILMRWE
ncbi:alkylresorcinol/alkylpyrone synthase [Bacillus ectoiniformans]|uniref:type III polyketide synthase n=1 Tax=Bacillus ectoiniformans TaxID=1494429 RepID=UPI00195624DD|nr:3-oxoacyl-[acyl-carrier-protein] synthase III C-terminal domain-containing protein [Bacillus ectoiniformans]MBM7647936.1 alkylresorcinol/alkylpyrone synthase [Bacillus ectoiniformans]